jgi:hypothetical protein
MKDFRIIVASVMLVYLSAITFSASASGGEREDNHRSSNTHGVRHEEENDDDDRSVRVSPRAKEMLKKMNELKKKREAEKKKKKSRSHTGTTLPPKPVSNTGSTSTGSNNTGTTNTGTTTAPVTKSATVNYNVPGGNVPVAFSVTVNNGVITAASSTSLSNGTSGYYQDSFAQGISNATVGKKVSGLSLSAVGGASLTTNAFKQFVTNNF